jgi:hypothetical protein
LIILTPSALDNELLTKINTTLDDLGPQRVGGKVVSGPASGLLEH